MSQGEPVRVLKKEVVVYGTHSHSKLKLFCKNVFTGQDSVLTLGHKDKVDLVDIKRKIGQVISKTSQNLMVMDNVSYETFEADVDEELMEELTEGHGVVFVEFGGKTKVLEKSSG